MTTAEATVEPYGSWRSPLAATTVAAESVTVGATKIVDGAVYLLERRPSEGGRGVVMRALPFGEVEDVTPPGFNVRSKVHEYGGGSYWVAGTTLFFSRFEDQRVYRQEGPGAEPVPITSETGGRVRHADGVVTADGATIVCVRERHEAGGVVNEIVAFSADGEGEAVILAGGRDFYAFPRLDPGGARLAWQCWDHPNMPWDGSEIWVADFDGTEVSGSRLAAGGPGESVFHPSFGPDGSLHLVSDRTGWWNLYREDHGELEALAPMDAEFGVPQWLFGFSTYGFLADGRIVCLYEADGRSHLALLDPTSRELLDLDLPFEVFEPYLAVEGSTAAFVAGGPAQPMLVATLDFGSRAVEIVRESARLDADPAFISHPRAIEFPTEGDRSAHAWFYPPTNPDFVGPQGERPPLLVDIHGGPTAESTPEYQPEIQFFTSRGFAVVVVNYGGSTGYGREYRERLKGNWGIVDVDDAAASARHLVELGEVDGSRLAIRGGSAGGFTTLAALTFRPGVFAAGTSYYGVADLERLAGDTHKFESRYLDGLVGPYPDAVEIYRERSPIHATDRLSGSLLLLQGLEDEVVPPAQAEAMVKALEAKGLPYAYLAFEGEQHGFRKAETIVRALEAELFFYSAIFGFESDDPIEPIEVHGLST